MDYAKLKKSNVFQIIQIFDTDGTYIDESHIMEGDTEEFVYSESSRLRPLNLIAGAVCKDHVHLSVVIPPKESISDFMGYLKGKSTLMIYDRHPELQSKWDKAFWARGYYVETIGNIGWHREQDLPASFPGIKQHDRTQTGTTCAL